MRARSAAQTGSPTAGGWAPASPRARRPGTAAGGRQPIRMRPVIEIDDLEPVDGGFRVKTTDAYDIDVIMMIFNWRVTATPRDGRPETWRGRCYFGSGPAAFVRAVLAAQAWDGDPSTSPPGWNKNIQTGEIRRSAQT